MTGPIRLEGGPMDGGYRCSCGEYVSFVAVEGGVPPCSRCGLPADRFGLFAEEFEYAIYPTGTWVRMDGGTVDIAAVMNPRWRRIRRAWSWLRYGGWR